MLTTQRRLYSSPWLFLLLSPLWYSFQKILAVLMSPDFSTVSSTQRAQWAGAGFFFPVFMPRKSLKAVILSNSRAHYISFTFSSNRCPSGWCQVSYKLLFHTFCSFTSCFKWKVSSSGHLREKFFKLMNDYSDVFLVFAILWFLKKSSSISPKFQIH